MKYEEHCKECLDKIGDEWNKVHLWLDATARDYFPWTGHRQIRHHTEGVEQVRKMWGDEAAEAAELHIISDEGYIPTSDQIIDKYGPSPFIEDKGEYPTYKEETTRPENWDGVKEFN